MHQTTIIRASKPFVLLLLMIFGFVGCGDSSSSAILPPKFVVTNTKHDHGVLTAQWYITISNQGGSGSQLVQYWVGDAKDENSRTVIYSERHTLGFGQQKTISIRWTHAGVGVIGYLLYYGSDGGTEFLP